MNVDSCKVLWAGTLLVQDCCRQLGVKLDALLRPRRAQHEWFTHGAASDNHHEYHESIHQPMKMQARHPVEEGVNSSAELMQNVSPANVLNSKERQRSSF